MSGVVRRLRSLDGAMWAVLAITGVALVIRVVGLGARTIQHDESLHAWYSWFYAEGNGYEHNPLMHGPLQFHLIALFFRLFGDGDAMARLPHTLLGTALVASPLLLRRWLGGAGVVCAAFFLAVSPSLLYYSRFARNDLPVALFAVLIVAAIWRYRADGRLRWLVLLSAGMALSFAAKETAYITTAVLLLYLDVTVAHALFESRRGDVAVSLAARTRAALWLVPTAWIFALLWRPLVRLRGRLGFEARPREADLLVVMATLVLPLLAAAVQIPLTAAGFEVTGDPELTIGIATSAALVALSTAIGLLWRGWWWAGIAAVFYLIAAPLYMSLGTNPAGIAGLFWTSMDYWLAQQDVQRGAQPGFYYLMLLPLYESLVLVPALVAGAWWGLWRRDPFALMLAWWFLASLAAFSFAGEKMPWLITHMALPLALLAAYGLGRAWPRILEAARAGSGSAWRWGATGLSGAVLALLVALAAYTDIGVNIDHPDDPIEPIMYAQATPEIPPLVAGIEAALASGAATRVVIDNDASLSWPWVWYLRRAPLTYMDRAQIRDGGLQPGDIVITSEGGDPGAGYAPAIRYRHYWWFIEDYQRTSAGDLLGGIRDGSLPRRWLSFLLERDARHEYLDREGLIYVPAGAEGVFAAGR